MTESLTALTDDQRTRIQDIVIEVLELEPGELTETASFVEDYDADSLLAIEVLARIESDLSVTIPQDDLEQMTSLGAVYAVVARRLDDGAGHA